jgi:hypothetical protein
MMLLLCPLNAGRSEWKVQWIQLKKESSKRIGSRLWLSQSEPSSVANEVAQVSAKWQVNCNVRTKSFDISVSQVTPGRANVPTTDTRACCPGAVLISTPHCTFTAASPVRRTTPTTVRQHTVLTVLTFALLCHVPQPMSEATLQGKPWLKGKQLKSGQKMPGKSELKLWRINFKT